MGHADYLAKGSWNAQCDRCDWKYKAYDLYLQKDPFGGNNLRVCRRCLDEINPQGYVKGVLDRQTPPWTRTPSPPVFVPYDAPTSNCVDGFIVNGCCVN